MAGIFRGLQIEAWAFRVAKINSLPQHSRTQNLTLLTCHADQLLFYIFFHLRSRHALLFNMHDTSAPHLIILLDLTFTNNHHHLWELNLSGLKYLLTIWSYKWTGFLSAAVLSKFVKMPCQQAYCKLDLIHFVKHELDL